MQVYILDKNPEKSAQYLCDQHLIKQILENAQILCSISSLDFHKSTHENHPVTRWFLTGDRITRQIKFAYLMRYTYELNQEYKYRFKKDVNHRSFDLLLHQVPALETLFLFCKDAFIEPDLSDFPKVFNGFTARSADTVEAFREYYVKYKMINFKKPMRWSMRAMPDWVVRYL